MDTSNGSSSLVQAGSSAASTSSAVYDEAERLKTLQAQIQARKRKRESLAATQQQDGVHAGTQDGAADSRLSAIAAGKAKAVTFDQDEAESPHHLPNGDSNGQATSILKPSSVPAKSQNKEKTTAKKRYLKRKLDRRKAKKRIDNGTTSSNRAEDVSVYGNSDDEPADTTTHVSGQPVKLHSEKHAEIQDDPSLGDTSMALDAVETAEEAKARRKAERKARKARTAVESDEPALNEDSVSYSRKQLAQQAKAVQATRVMQATQRKEERAAKRAKLENGIVEEPVEQMPPTQPGELPRFPAPERPAAPSQRELDAMMISHDMRDAMVIPQDGSVPVSQIVQHFDISSSIQEKLNQQGITSFFAVQAAVLPVLLRDRYLYSSSTVPRDICVSAPTGSGKTLGYVIPIVEILSTRVITRLRALIVLPTRDLVAQVRDVFEQMSRSTGLKIGVATGHHSFSHEQTSLVDSAESRLSGGSSKVDILIATPGRLMDHLRSTPGFTLQHLRFIVMDEADRLLNQSFNDWMLEVMRYIEMPLSSLDDTVYSAARSTMADVVAPTLLHSIYPMPRTELERKVIPCVQKLLFSATLTRDPAKLAGLRLNKPIFLAVTSSANASAPDVEGQQASVDTIAQLASAEQNFVLPATLKESMVVTTSADKALVLFHLLLKGADASRSLPPTICFTKSVESAGRLVQLLQAFLAEYNRSQPSGDGMQDIRVEAFSSELSAGRRKEVLSSFNKGETQMLVCSDLVARGMDLPLVAQVINYDVPVDMRKYVHRVGRTARAGREGEAWTLVETQEAKYFKDMMKGADRYPLIKKRKVTDKDLDLIRDCFVAALDSLREV